MTTKEAIGKRVHELCAEQNITINALSYRSGIAASTIYSMLNEKSMNPGVVSIKKLCDGLDISLREFFDCDLFNEVEKLLKAACFFIYDMIKC